MATDGGNAGRMPHSMPARETEALRVACPLCVIWRTYGDEYKQQLKDVTQRLMNQRKELAQAQGYVQRAKEAATRVAELEAREAALRDALADELQWDFGGPGAKRLEALRALLIEFEQLPVRRVTNETVVLERAPLDDWRTRCGEAARLGAALPARKAAP